MRNGSRLVLAAATDPIHFVLHLLRHRRTRLDLAWLLLVLLGIRMEGNRVVIHVVLLLLVLRHVVLLTEECIGPVWRRERVRLCINRRGWVEPWLIPSLSSRVILIVAWIMLIVLTLSEKAIVRHRLPVLSVVISRARRRSSPLFVALAILIISCLPRLIVILLLQIRHIC